MRVSNLDARALRGYRDLSSVMTVNETAAAAIRVEQVMAGASLFNISLAKAEQDRLFSYAVKMRRQLSREDAKRSQDSLRDEERRRREEQERKGGG